MENHSKIQVKISSLREKLQTAAKRGSTPSSPLTRAQTESSSRLPHISRRSASSNVLITQDEDSPLSRDVSHIHDNLMKRANNYTFRKSMLNEILGIKENEKGHITLPINLLEIEKEILKIREKEEKEEENKSKTDRNPIENAVKECDILFKSKFEDLNIEIEKVYGRKISTSYSPIRAIIRANSERQLARPDTALRVPSGRKEVEILNFWLDYMIDTQVNQVSDIEFDKKIKVAQLIYSRCFKEIIRQISVHCIERGELMEKVWSGLLNLFSQNDIETTVKIEKKQKVLEEVLTKHKEKHEELIKAERSEIKKLHETIKCKDKYIQEISAEVNDLKDKIESYKSRVRELSESLSKAVRNTSLLYQQFRDIENHVTINEEEFSFYSEEDEPKEEKPESKMIKIDKAKLYRPMILAGYFDLTGKFHRKQQFIRDDDNVLKAADFSYEIAQMVELRHKGTSTEEDIEVIVINNATTPRDIKNWISPGILKFIVGLYSLQLSGKAKYNMNKFTQTFVLKDIARQSKIEIKPPFKRRDTTHIIELPGEFASIGIQTNDIVASPRKGRSPGKRAMTIIRKNKGKIKALYSKMEEKMINEYLGKEDVKSNLKKTESVPALESTSPISFKRKSNSPDKNKISNLKIASSTKGRSNTLFDKKSGESSPDKPEISCPASNKGFSSSLKVVEVADKESFTAIDANEILPIKDKESFTAEEANEVLPTKMLKKIEKLKESVNVMLVKENFSSASVAWDEETKENAHKLRVMLDSLYPLQESNITTSITPVKLFHAYVQTDISGENIFIDRVFSTAKTSRFDEEMTDEPSYKCMPSKSKTKISDFIIESDQSPEKSFESVESPYKSPQKEKPKHTTIAKAFVLGQIKQRIVVSHPGQIFLNKFMTHLISNYVRRIMNVQQLMKIINKVYSEKISLSRESVNHKRHEASMVLYDVLINQYGLKDVAKMKFQQTILASLSFKQYPRVANFVKFLGIEGNFSVDDWNLYLFAVEYMYSCNIGPYIYNKETSPVHYCPYERAIKCTYTFFENRLDNNIFQELIEQVRSLRIEEPIQKSSRLVRTSISSIDKIDTDQFLILILDYYHKLKDSYLKRLAPRTEKYALLTLLEFLRLFRSKAELKLTEDELVKIFHQLSISKIADDKQLVQYITLDSFLSYVVDNDIIIFDNL
ncbi:unnamed protein product [Blepharisma stoltei]|uniref:Uncharacterized protein n=1 Tax=Blepharisma stoltei TaxID=1481888 RepID=A0AAU9J283_9CILI|nr:unnamed protein product [Blepharisma stoltei]